MREITFLEAIREAILQEMRADERVFVLGEDVGEFGGAFKATAGLFEEFGRRRVLDTPMCEWTFVGVATGSALMGLRPIVEIQFADFISTGFDTIVQFMATNHYRWGEPVPVVIRAPWGGGASAGPFHSQCPEAWFAHVPGLKVVIPSNPYDAKGLLTAAIRDPNPVIFFEPKYLYRRSRGRVPEEQFTVPIGKAAVVRSGEDLSLFTYGAMVEVSLKAAETLAGEGVSCEVVDLRTVSPLDEESVLASVRRTGKALVVHEARQRCGVGAEVSASIAEKAFEYLDAPLLRVTAPDTPVPYSPPLEAAYRPGPARIAEAARRLAAY